MAKNELKVHVIIGNRIWTSGKAKIFKYTPEQLKTIKVDNFIKDVKEYCLDALRADAKNDWLAASLLKVPEICNFKWDCLELDWVSVSGRLACIKRVTLTQNKFESIATVEDVMVKSYVMGGGSKTKSEDALTVLGEGYYPTMVFTVYEDFSEKECSKPERCPQ